MSDFIPCAELAKLTGLAVKTLHNHHAGRARQTPLSTILTKFGGRVGVWRADYDQWLRAQRKLPDASSRAVHS